MSKPRLRALLEIEGTPRSLPKPLPPRPAGTFLRAYRWQYTGSGVADDRFQKVLGDMIDAQQMARIGAALAPILA